MELFSRVGRHVMLTPEGRSLAERVRVLLNEFEQTLEYAQRLSSGKTVTLRIGAGAANIERAMPALMQRYRERWPHVELQLRSDGAFNLISAVERGEIDVAMTRYVRSDILRAKVAFPTHLVAVVALNHPLATRQALTIEQLNGERLLVAPIQFSTRVLIDRAFRERHMRPRIVLESHDLSTLIALAEVGQGVAIVPSTACGGHRPIKTLPVFHRDQPLGSWTALVWDRRRPLPRFARAFVDEAIGQLERGYPGHELGLPPLPRAGPLHLQASRKAAAGSAVT
jgi:DNA-binding transcriptional LysR family regulator